MVVVRPKSQGARKFTKNLQRKGKGSLGVRGGKMAVRLCCRAV